ncbi:MAG: HAMP domain-containing protein [Clostridiaceae bacterium]|nr:HAMP domain-containing protein [Clostridiaceae bacterium]
MLRKLKIRQIILFLIVLPLIIVIVGVTTLSILQLDRVTGDMRRVLYDEGLAATSSVLNADRDMYQGLSAMQEMAALDSTNRTVSELEADILDNFDQVLQRVDEAEAILNNNRSVWEKYRNTTSNKTVFESFEQVKADFGGWYEIAAQMVRNNRVSVIYATTFLDDFNSARTGMNEATDTLEIAMIGEVDAISNLINTSALMIIIVVAASFIIVIGLTLIVTNNIARIVRRASNMLDELSAGHLSTRVDIKDGSRDEMSLMIKKMNVFADDLQNNFVGNLQKISHGDLNVDIDNTDEQDEISPALQQTVASLKLLISEADRLTAAASAGELTARGDASRLEGAYATIIGGFNSTLDGVVEPVEEAKLVLGRLALNDLTVPMSDKYAGMMAELSNDINQVRDNLIDLQDAIVKASRGDIRRLQEFRKRGQLSENDQLTPSVFAVYSAIQEIIRAAYELTKAATGGDLSKRADVDAFEGGYRRIIDGFNKTIDALVAPIQDAALVIQALSNGDLTIEMEGEYKGDNAILKTSLNGAIESFNRLLSSIRQASDEVATGAREMSRSSQTLSQGATEQASSVEQVTASIEQLADQTKQNASNAGAASQLSEQARHSADTGNTRMSSMLEAMTEINDSSKNISKIIKVIDDIAFQTNILALNAAVEAARAGQHGKGFAVVAEEVRNLAARSAEAAKETTVLIEKSIGHVNDGTDIAEKTAEALNDIVDKVTKTNELILMIAESSNEQASGIAQINTGLVQVSKVVQMNSATSEESAAASEELSSQAELLKDFVGQFNLKEVVDVKEETAEPVKSYKTDATQAEVNESRKSDNRKAEPKQEKKEHKSTSKHNDPLSDTSFGDF